MRRREFLRAGAAAGALGLLKSRPAWASLWADPPDEAAAHVLGKGVRAERCLEMFLYGGLSPWESFYVVPEYGTPADPDHPDQQWYLFADEHLDVFGSCGMRPADYLQPWALDSLGNMVHLGPITMPFRQRPDILERLRVIVMRHDLEPHEAAIPISLSGHRLGNPRMAGMGAHLQRWFQERHPGRVTPWSYVLTPDNEIETDNLRVASSVGVHPGSARPLALKVALNNPFVDRLERGHLGDSRDQVDDLLAHYAARARARYRTDAGADLRSKGLEDHDFALRSLINAPSLVDVLGKDFLARHGGESCDVENAVIDRTAMSIEAAATLMTHPTDPATYVNIVDGGLTVADGGGGYDTHFVHLPTQAVNGTHMMRTLAAHINEPGENDPDKLDLDDTLIIVNSEFGRTPFKQSFRGTNHHPYGYVTVVIGGPVGADQAGVLGGIGPDGNAVDYITPSEHRAAMLVAMGLYPFAHESFAVGDIRDMGSELEALIWLKEHVLGRV